MILRLATALAVAATSASPAQDRAPVEPASLPAPDQPVAAVKPAVEKLDGTRFRVGKVTFDSKTREIRFPAQVNMTEGLLEYLVVREDGKIHEALFATTASPTNVNLALTLLRFKPSRELYLLPNGTGGVTDQFPEVPEETKAAARIDIDIEWRADGRTRRQSANDWIQHANRNSAMPAGPWVYGGSEFHDGKYAAEMSGDIAAIFISLSSPINYPGADNQDDTVWIPFPGRIPAEGTTVTIIFSPHTPSKTP